MSGYKRKGRRTIGSMVEADKAGRIEITTIHTLKGAGFWGMSIARAKTLRDQLDRAIRYVEGPEPLPQEGRPRG